MALQSFPNEAQYYLLSLSKPHPPPPPHWHGKLGEVLAHTVLYEIPEVEPHLWFGWNDLPTHRQSRLHLVEEAGVWLRELL